MTSPDPAHLARQWLESFGATRNRWPEARRAEVEAAIAASPELARLDREMAALDSLLDGWADAPAGDAAAVDRILRHVEPQIVPPRRGIGLPVWLAGGAAAAGVAAVLMLAPPRPAPAPAPAASALAAEDDGSVEAFRLLFTPTADEELAL